MKLTGILTAGVLLSLLLCSCASSSRMLRLSPLNDSGKNIDLNTSLVNIWPLYYQHNEYVTALWPLFDYDAQGFAIRPFYNREGDDHSILFPLSSWNCQTGRGMALNTFWGPRHFFFIPLYYQNRNFYSILLPLSAWWTGENRAWIVNTYWNEDRDFVFFPLYYQLEDSYSILYPLSAWQKDLKSGRIINTSWDANKKILNFFPLYRSSPHFSHIANVYWFKNDKTSVTNYGFFPLFHHNIGFRQWLIPFYYYEYAEKPKYTVFTPLFGYTRDDEKLQMLNILLAAYYYNEGKDWKVRSICWPLIYHEFKDKRERFHILPFYSYDTHWPALVNWTPKESLGNGTRSNFNILGPFGYQQTIRQYDRPKELLPFLMPPSGTTRGSLAKLEEKDHIMLALSAWGREKYLTWQPAHERTLQEVTRLLRQRQNRQDAKTPQAREQLEECNRNLANKLALLPGTAPESTNEELTKMLLDKYTQITESTYHHLLPFYRFRRYGDNYHWHSIFYLLGSGFKDQESYGIRINPFFSYKNLTQDYPKRSGNIPYRELNLLWPLYHTSRAGEESEWHSLFFLARGEQKNDYSDFRILHYLYRYTTEKDAEQYSVFPFITYRQNAEKSQFSFLWRVFNYEKTADGASGHFFFIPW